MNLQVESSAKQERLIFLHLKKEGKNVFLKASDHDGIEATLLMVGDNGKVYFSHGAGQDLEALGFQLESGTTEVARR